MQKLTATQLAEWEAYNMLDPIGEERGDYRTAYLSSLLTNIAIRTNGKRGDKLTNVKDFMFEWDPEKREKPKMGVEQMKAVFQQIAATSRSKKDNENRRRRRKPPRLKK